MKHLVLILLLLCVASVSLAASSQHCLKHSRILLKKYQRMVQREVSSSTPIQQERMFETMKALKSFVNSLDKRAISLQSDDVASEKMRAAQISLKQSEELLLRYKEKIANYNEQQSGMVIHDERAMKKYEEIKKVKQEVVALEAYIRKLKKGISENSL